MDQYILKLVEVFQANPLHFFHEKELHLAFSGIAREGSSTASTTDGQTVHLLRQDYNTLWRYRRKGLNGFAIRFDGEGGVGAIDFALLRKEFVETNDYLTVMNKEEPLRRALRVVPWPQNDL